MELENYGSGEYYDDHVFEYTPENIALLQRLAAKAIESGFVVNPEGPARDYIDHFLPA